MRSLQITAPPPSEISTEIDSPPDIAASAPVENDNDQSEGYRQHSIQIIDSSKNDTDDFESCFAPVHICAVELIGVDEPCPMSAETVILPPEHPPAPDLVLHRLAATYDTATSLSYAHTDNGSMANTVHDATLLFAYRPIKTSMVRLLDAGNHAHHPLGVGFLCVPTANRGIAGAPTSVFIRTYHTPTIPGIIISLSAMSKQLRTSSYTTSHSDTVGFIHFPHRLRRCQDIYITIQPTSQRGGLTFTEALLLPTSDQHTAPIPPAIRVLRLCSDHRPGPPSSIVDPSDGMFCQECQLPPLSDFR